MSKQGFIMLFREKGEELLINDPKAFLLLTLIALRARRTELRFARRPLKVNQAFIGDHEIIGLSRQQYRDVQDKLEEYGLVEFESTNKGTIATLMSAEIYSINPASDNSKAITKEKNKTGQKAEEPSNSSIEINQEEPTKNQLGTNEQPSDNHELTIQDPSENHREANEAPLTNNDNNEIIQKGEECEEQYKATSTRSSSSVDGGLYPCLRGFSGTKGFQLTDDEKLDLMNYPEERVEMAIEYASHATIEIIKDLPSILHWHCSEEEPIPPPEHKRSAKKWQPKKQDHGDREERRRDEGRRTSPREGGLTTLGQLLQQYPIPPPKET